MPKPKVDPDNIGPATREGYPIGLGDVADLTVNTGKGIARGIGKMLKGDTKGMQEEHERTVEENRAISKKAAEKYFK